MLQVPVAKVAVLAATFAFDRPYTYKIPQPLADTLRPGCRVMVPFSRGNRPCEGMVLALDKAEDDPKLKPITRQLDPDPILSPELIRLAVWMHDRFFCTIYDALHAILPAGVWYRVSTVYCAAPELDAAAALAQCGRSKQRRLALETVLEHGGRCPLDELQAAFGDKDPASALHWLVEQKFLTVEGTQKRVVRDKQLEYASLAVPLEEAQEEIRRRRRAPHQVAILELLCTIGRASAGEVCQFTGAPRSSMKALVQQGVVHIDTEPYFRRPVHYTGQPQPIPALTPAQEQVFDGLKELLRAPDAQAALLFGVTGSGKTLVYLHLIAQALAAGQGVILLVPEISLTPQMIEAFSAYFGDTVAVLHSGLPLSERYDEWKRIRAGLARVVVGTRSAVFAPVQELGLLIIDEEQEDTYKSESTPRYHARDVAKFRCAQHRALLLLGSATPDVVSRYYAETGRYHYFTLPDRFNAPDAQAALLFGVTGSGKTLVYLHLIAQALAAGQGVILLVPEISLTPQMIEAFSAYFGDTVAVLHSGLPLSERYDEWKRIRAGLARVVVGTRSAVFAPVQELGLLIIDEEQEDTYKSESTPRYHARDVAKFRCAQHRALLLLGSATPDVVSRYYAETGRYHYFTLPDRFNARKLPDVIIADMKQELRNGNSGSISSVLYGELEENLRRGEQSILFLNRRGASKIVTCAECGATYSCPNCSVSLTYHQGNQMLICHHCGYRRRVDPQCPVCGGELRFLGDGTERIEADLHALFPGVETLRMDADAIAMAGTHEALLQRFARERIPIMIGTQMITKGLNFENVTLVGVLNADQSLYVGDYRANERTFSLITQVIGRSGRGDAPGRAVIQTFTPANETIRQAARQDYDAFYRSEIRLRKLNGTPPFSEVLAVTVSGAQENAVVRCCAYIRDYFRQTIGERAEVLGPAPLPVVRMNNRYRYRVTLYCNQSKAVRRAAANIVMYCNTEKSFRDVTVFADDNPLD